MTTAFDLRANLIVLEVTLEGVRRRFLLDTGASASVVGSGTARELGIQERRRLAGRGAGGDVPVGVARVGSIAVGDSEVRDLTCMVMDLDGLSERIGERIDGILGYDFLSGFVLTIDYGERSLTFVRNDEGAPRQEAEASIDGPVFRHPGFGLRVERPDGHWDFVTETPLPDIPVILRHRGGGQLTLQLQVLHGLTLESVWPSIEASLPLQVEEFQRLSDRYTSSGFVVDYRGIEDGRLQRFRLYAAMKDATLMMLVAQSDPEAFQELEEGFEAIARSVQLDPPAGP